MGVILAGVGLVGLAGATFVLGSPIVHLTHRKPGTAALSFAMRLLPGVAILALRKEGAVAAALTGSVVAAAVVGADDFVLAREERTSPTIAIRPSAGGATLVLGRRF